MDTWRFIENRVKSKFEYYVENMKIKVERI